MGGKGSGKHSKGNVYVREIIKLVLSNKQSETDRYYKLANTSYFKGTIGNYRVLIGRSKCSLGYKTKTNSYEVLNCSQDDCRFIFMLLVKRELLKSVLTEKYNILFTDNS